MVGGGGGVSVGGLGPPLSGVSVNVGPITRVGVGVGVTRRRVADGDGVGVAEVVPVAVTLGVKLAVAVFVACISVGVAVGVRVTVLVASTPGATRVAVLVEVGVGVDINPGPTTINAVAQMVSNASRAAAVPSILRRFVRCAATNAAAGKRLVSVGSASDRVRARLRAERISLALANRLAMGTSIARRITRSISGEMVGLISRSERNAPGFDTRRVTVAGGSPVSR